MTWRRFTRCCCTSSPWSSTFKGIIWSQSRAQGRFDVKEIKPIQVHHARHLLDTSHYRSEIDSQENDFKSQNASLLFTAEYFSEFNPSQLFVPTFLHDLVQNIVRNILKNPMIIFHCSAWDKNKFRTFSKYCPGHSEQSNEYFPHFFFIVLVSSP